MNRLDAARQKIEAVRKVVGTQPLSCTKTLMCDAIDHLIDEVGQITHLLRLDTAPPQQLEKIHDNGVLLSFRQSEI